MTFLYIAAAVVFCVALSCAVIDFLSYALEVGDAKTSLRFQEFSTCKALASVYATLDGAGFSSCAVGSHELLMYSPDWDEHKFSHTNYLIVMPWPEYRKFRVWLSRWERDKYRRSRIRKQCRNNSNDALRDIMSRINGKIDENNRLMRDAVAQQAALVKRITPFERDYVKSKIDIV